MKNLLYLSFITLFSIALIYSCSAEEEDTTPPPSVVATPEPEPPAPTQYTLTVTSGVGGTVSTEGGTYDEGTEVTITATPDDGYEFVGWEGVDGESTTLTITLNSNLTLEANFELYSEQFCGISLLEWTSHDMGYNTIFYNKIGGQDYVIDKDFENDNIKSPKILDKYVVLHSIGETTNFDEIQSICSDISINEDLSLNVDFSFNYNSESLDGYLMIHSGVIDVAGNLRKWQDNNTIPPNFMGTTSDYFPKRIGDINDNLIIEFNYEYSLFSGENNMPDVFLIDMFVFPDSNGFGDKQKEIGIMLSRGEYSQDVNEIILDNRLWFDEPIGETSPHPSYQEEEDSYFKTKFYVIKESKTEMLDQKMTIRLKPFINDLIEKGFINENEYLMFIQTGVEPREGRNKGSFLNLYNYKIISD